MSAARLRFAGLGSRVAARTFALFCLCAVVPIIVSAIVADRTVRTKLRNDAVGHLESISKSYGLLVFERLQQTEQAAANLATLVLEDRLAQDDIRSFSSSHFKIVDVTDAVTIARRGSLSLHGTQVRITVTRQSGPRKLQITAAVDAAYLWNADAVYQDALNICVHGPDGQALHCAGTQAQAARSGTHSLSGEWSLFLAPSYGAATWRVRTEQPASVALRALDSFERTLPIVTLIAIVIALLLSTVQIRRSHRPLALLTDAVEHMGRRGVHRRVKVDTNDEYQHLAQAFNRMASGLARQFELIRALARIDRMILDDPSTGVLVEKILPALPRLLRTPAVAIAVATRESGKVAIWWSSATATTVQHLQTDPLLL